MKHRYLIGPSGAQKLKRNVPKYLQPLAGKTAWVESVRNLDASTLKQRAHLFASRTDAEITKLRSQLTSKTEPDLNADTELDLPRARVEQIALSYFHDRLDALTEKNAFFTSPKSPEFSALLADAAEDYSDALDEAAGEIVRTDIVAVRLLVDHGVITANQHDALLESGWPERLQHHRNFQLLCRLRERANLELASLRLKALQNGEISGISDSFFASTVARQVSENAFAKHTISHLREEYLADRRPNVSASRYAQYVIPFRALTETFGDSFPISNVTRDDCRQLIRLFASIPSYVSLRYPECRLEEASRSFEVKTGKPAGRHSEAQKHAQVLKSAFEFAVREGWLERNPWVGLSVPVPPEKRKKHTTKANSYEPFTIDDLNRIFAHETFAAFPSTTNANTPKPVHLYWTPILALWTGMRMNEILQLEKKDVVVSQNHPSYIAVTDEEKSEPGQHSFNKRLKTTNSVRDIPVHPKLIEIGFLGWVSEQPDGRLFPQATSGAGEKPSDLFSKRFATLLKAVKVWKSRRRVFHSFRNSFNDALRDAGIPLEIRETINGWRSQKSMDTRYGRGEKIERLQEAVAKVDYSGLKIEHLIHNASKK